MIRFKREMKKLEIQFEDKKQEAMEKLVKLLSYSMILNLDIIL